jgi:hypothetical protein
MSPKSEDDPVVQAARPRAGTLPSTFHLRTSSSTPSNPASRLEPSITSARGSGERTSTAFNSFQPRLNESVYATVDESDGDEHIRTLDYLGLAGDDQGESNDVIAVVDPSTTRRTFFDHSLPSTESISSPSSGIGRMRSSTIGSFNRLSEMKSTLQPTAPRDYIRETFSRHAPSPSLDLNRLLHSNRPSPSAILSHDSLLSSDPINGTVGSNRPRAATIGMSGDQREMPGRRRAGTTVDGLVANDAASGRDLVSQLSTARLSDDVRYPRSLILHCAPKQHTNSILAALVLSRIFGHPVPRAIQDLRLR